MFDTLTNPKLQILRWQPQDNAFANEDDFESEVFKGWK